LSSVLEVLLTGVVVYPANSVPVVVVVVLPLFVNDNLVKHLRLNGSCVDDDVKLGGIFEVRKDQMKIL
uniref:Ovule protein n=1 Tax=Brugia timori TaxID=42155 RepID=A0A0R3R0P8_9BILA